jgi:hypothetical protein
MFDPENEDVDVPLDADEGSEFDVEIEEVDDTPEPDKGRRDIDYDPTDETHARDDEKLPEKFQQRINAVTAAMHTERRAKEARDRQLQEAVDYARKVSGELAAVRKQANLGERAYVSQVKTNTDHELERATADVEHAYEAGDPKALAQAQAKLALVAARKHSVDSYQPVADIDEADVYQYTPSEDPAPTHAQPSTAVQQWVSKNPWFNQDKARTDLALSIHAELINDGVIAESPRYFRELDSEIQRRTERQPTQRKQSAPPVASGRTAQRAAPRKVTLTRAQVEVAKRMGVTPEQYARELIKLGDL